MHKILLKSLIILLLGLVACQPAQDPATVLAEHNFAGTYMGADNFVPDFQLTSDEGPVKLSDFEGQYVIIYYGYTFCPDFCPITLSQMANVREELGDSADKLQVMMVTVDPARDTADLLGNYVRVFDDSFIGLTGSDEEIKQATEPLGIFYEIGEVAENNEYYLVNHTTRTYLIDPNGAGILTWRHETPTDSIVNDINFLLSVQTDS